MLDESAAEIFENLPELENKLQNDVKAALVYVAGYVVKNDVTESAGTNFYFMEYGDYTAELNRGGLTIPKDNICQWTFFSYIIFHDIVNKICRKSLCNVLMLISEYYSLNMEKKHGMKLANILLKNHTKLYSPRCSKEAKQKVLNCPSRYFLGNLNTFITRTL